MLWYVIVWVAALAHWLAHLPTCPVIICSNPSPDRGVFFFRSIQPKIGTRHLLGSKGGQSDIITTPIECQQVLKIMQIPYPILSWCSHSKESRFTLWPRLVDTCSFVCFLFKTYLNIWPVLPYRLWPSLLSGQVLGSKDMISITWPTKHQLIYNNKVLAPYTNWRQLAKRSHLGFFFACQGKRFQLRAGRFGKLATFCGTLHSSATCSEINGNIQNILIAKNVANRQHKPGLIATFWSGYVTTFKPYTQ